MKGLGPEQVFKRHGGLRWHVLFMLSNGPKRGIDIIDSIERASWGFWRPSPGTIYPLLKALENEGLVSRKDGFYHLTEEGSSTIGLSPGSPVNGTDVSQKLEKAVDELESYLDYLDDMRTYIGDLEPRIRGISDKLVQFCNSLDNKGKQKKGAKDGEK